VRFVVLTVTLVQIQAFWDVNVPANRNWRFRGHNSFHIQGIIYCWNREDWNRKLLRKASHYLLTDTASYYRQRECFCKLTLELQTEEQLVNCLASQGHKKREVRALLFCRTLHAPAPGSADPR